MAVPRQAAPRGRRGKAERRSPATPSLALLPRGADVACQGRARRAADGIIGDLAHFERLAEVATIEGRPVDAAIHRRVCELIRCGWPHS